MCLYCGGSRAGSGDMLLISLATDVSLAIVKVQSIHAARKRKDAGTGHGKETGTESASDQEDCHS